MTSPLVVNLFKYGIWRAGLVVSTVCLIVSACGGCGDDNLVATAPKGTIVVDPRNGIAAPWSLTGAGGFHEIGVDSVTLFNVEPGTYDIDWLSVEGYLTPDPQSGDLSAGATLRFTGQYIQPGQIAIQTIPVRLDAGWEIVGPGLFHKSGVGDAYFDSLMPGSYLISWTSPDHWTMLTPQSSSNVLAEGSTMTIAGEWEYVVGARHSLDDAWSQFEIAYGFELESLLSVLFDEEFRFIKQDSDILDREAMLDICKHMFDHDVGPRGHVIGNIHFEDVQPQGIWVHTPPTDPYFGGLGVQQRTYDVKITFELLDQDRTLIVMGPVVIYVVDADGGSATDFRVIGIYDQTDEGSEIDEWKWTQVIGLFESD